MPSTGILGAVRSIYKNQVLVDEATDFSVLQLACMYELSHPLTRSFFMCGDLNQRLTGWGIKSYDEIDWIAPSIVRRKIVVSYRQSGHPRHGEGRVVHDLGDTIIVRFGAALEQVERGELEVVRSLADALTEGVSDDPLAALARAQALLIRSINDQWGVFSRSRVQLLPHQLWVCRQVTQHWPARWLVADDVGLGKTIEAGLILTPLLAGGRIQRLLILAPARLVPQWRARMKSMFDIRLQEYTREQDRGKISFWDTASQVVASFHTLRQPAARDRLLAAEPWDMVMVDEAHHFQAQERISTQTYDLLRELQEKNRIQSRHRTRAA